VVGGLGLYPGTRSIRPVATPSFPRANRFPRADESELMSKTDQLGVHPAKIVQLKREAHHARERLDEYRAEVKDVGSSSRRRLIELKQAADYAEARLERARRS
jgi:hypothetical protein